MALIEKIVVAVSYAYGASDLKTNIVRTDVYFNDGTSLQLDGYWVFKVGESYSIDYNGGNPVIINNVTMKI